MNKVKCRVAPRALLLSALIQATMSGPVLAGAEAGILVDRGAWSASDRYVAGDVVTFNGRCFVAQTSHAGSTPPASGADWAIVEGANPPDRSESGRTVRYAGSYHAGTSYTLNDVVTKNGVSYRALSSGARDDPADDVFFAGGYWAAFANADPLWAIGSTQPLGNQGAVLHARSTDTRGAVRLVDHAAAAPTSRVAAANSTFCDEVRPYNPPYETGRGDSNCSVRTRTDYAMVSLLMPFSVIQDVAK